MKKRKRKLFKKVHFIFLHLESKEESLETKTIPESEPKLVRRKSSKSRNIRKSSLDLVEFTEETTEFMNECVTALKSDIFAENYENALNTVESNVNELMFDYKELVRYKDEEEEEDYLAKSKELKNDMRLLTFYKIALKALLQINVFKASDHPSDLEMAASLANILVLPPVNEDVRKVFFKIAIEQNMN